MKAEYIERKKLVNSLKMWLMDLENDMDKGDYGELSENKGAREALENCICEIEEQKAADVQAVDRWISVEDRLPEEIGYYLVVIGNEMLVSIDIAEYSENHWHKHDKVLYWQPLPDYPDATKG